MSQLEVVVVFLWYMNGHVQTHVETPKQKAKTMCRKVVQEKKKVEIVSISLPSSSASDDEPVEDGMYSPGSDKALESPEDVPAPKPKRKYTSNARGKALLQAKTSLLKDDVRDDTNMKICVAPPKKVIFFWF